MWIADKWIDYAVIDTSSGEKLERWGKYTLVRMHRIRVLDRVAVLGAKIHCPKAGRYPMAILRSE